MYTVSRRRKPRTLRNVADTLSFILPGIPVITARAAAYIRTEILPGEAEIAMSAEGVRAAWDKYKFAALVIALGAALMLWPTAAAPSPTPAPQSRDLQGDLQAALGKIRDVGAVWVLLTEESSPAQTLARDRKISFRGDEYSESSETVLLDAPNGEAVVVTRTESATYRGALVVCEGGDLPAVKLAVTEAVTALTGLPANRVAVVKCQ